MYAKQLEQKSVHIDDLHRLLNTYKNQVGALFAIFSESLILSASKQGNGLRAQGLVVQG
jgi:hypothetical protein